MQSTAKPDGVEQMSDDLIAQLRELAQVVHNDKHCRFDNRGVEETMLNAANALERRDEDADELIAAFAHYHINAGDGTDACKACGLDLRDSIHSTTSLQAARSRKTRRRAAIDALNSSAPNDEHQKMREDTKRYKWPL